MRRLPAEPDGELVHVTGRVRVLKSLRPLVADRRAAYRRLVYHVGRHHLVHEAAEDFWLVADDGEPVLVEVAGARLLGSAGASDRHPFDSPVGQALRELPAPEEMEGFLDDYRDAARPPAFSAAELLVGDGDLVEVVGYKARTIDAKVAMRLERDLPIRTTMRGGKTLPLLICPADP